MPKRMTQHELVSVNHKLADIIETIMGGMDRMGEMPHAEVANLIGLVLTLIRTDDLETLDRAVESLGAVQLQWDETHYRSRYVQPETEQVQA
jgi:hypothetical protein